VLLVRAIESALDQQGPPVRISVFDNCSGDETGDIVRGMMARHQGIEYHCHDRNIGGAANFEHAIRSIRTPYFSLLSDDDYLLPDFYRKGVAALEIHGQAMFWAGITLNVDECGVVWDARLERWPREGLFLPPDGAMFMTGGMAPTWTGVLFRREVLDRIGCPDQETLGPSDLDYLLRIGATCPFLVEKHPAAVFTLSSDSYSATQPLSGFWPGWVRMIEKMRNLEGLQPAFRERFTQALDLDARRMLLRRAINALASNRPDFALDAALALESHYRSHLPAKGLRATAWLWAHLPGFRWLLGSLYRSAERTMVGSRAHLRRKYAGLIRVPGSASNPGGASRSLANDPPDLG
jgi:glycosyltransferase involved in cell wall biosynthesis